MKSIVNRILVFVVAAALTGVTALGQTIEKTVSFQKSVDVNGTVIKKGTYKVAFNEETGELTIRKGGKVLATAPAKLEKTNERYAFYTSTPSTDPDKAAALVSVSLKDGNLARIVNAADNTGLTVRQ